MNLILFPSTSVINLPSALTLFCGKMSRRDCCCCSKKKQNKTALGVVRISCPWSKENELHGRLYNASIIFYDANTFRSMYWVIQQWGDYFVSCRNGLNNSNNPAADASSWFNISLPYTQDVVHFSAGTREHAHFTPACTVMVIPTGKSHMAPVAWKQTCLKKKKDKTYLLKLP